MSLVAVAGPTCSAEGCERGPIARGLCDKHYRRERDRERYATDPEVRRRAIERSKRRHEQAKEAWIAKGCPPREDATKHRRTRRAKIYGLTVEQLAALELAQDHRCAVCRQPPKEGFALCIDHSHETGQVRGLLCIRCNRAIGLLGDDVELLEAAISYLRRSR